MFGIYLLHAAYAILMISFTFRIMIIPHAIVVWADGPLLYFCKRLNYCAYSYVFIRGDSFTYGL